MKIKNNTTKTSFHTSTIATSSSSYRLPLPPPPVRSTPKNPANHAPAKPRATALQRGSAARCEECDVYWKVWDTFMLRTAECDVHCREWDTPLLKSLTCAPILPLLPLISHGQPSADLVGGTSVHAYLCTCPPLQRVQVCVTRVTPPRDFGDDPWSVKPRSPSPHLSAWVY